MLAERAVWLSCFFLRGAPVAAADLAHILSLLRGYVEHVVATNEGVSVFSLELPVHVLLRLLHRNVHVAIKACQHTCARKKGGNGRNGGPVRCDGVAWARQSIADAPR